MEKFIYLPVEVKVREFDSKLLLALELARGGGKAIVCTRGYCNDFNKKPNGVVLAKSIAGFELDNIIKHKKHGNKYTSLDIEGILNISHLQQSFRFSQKTIDEVDKLFINGKNELERIRMNNYKFDDSKIEIVGAPQFDFYKKPLSNSLNELSSVYQARYGKYILILSRFGESNNKYKKEEQTWEEFYNETLKLDVSKGLLDLYSKFGENSEKIFKCFIEKLLPEVAEKFSDFTVIVRPHPTEKLETWEDAAKGLDNVKVVFEGAVGPWIQGSEFVIHNGCTTAIESYLLGKPIISYVPYKSKEYDLHIANMTGKECASVEKVVAVGKSIVNGNYEKVDVDKELKDYIHNVDNDAYIKLSAELLKVAENINKKNPGKLRGNTFKILKAKLISRFKKNSSLLKFPYTSKKEVQLKVNNICSCIGMDNKKIKVQEVGFNSFLIYEK